jgi:sialate O-acetylesterase
MPCFRLTLLLPAFAAAEYAAQPGGMHAPFVYPSSIELAAPPAPAPGISFSGVFTDHTVLQRGTTAQAAVYGAVTGAATGVTVSVSEVGAAEYSVKAQIVEQTAENVTWKALLHPHAAYGGNVTITASCAGCSGNTSAAISDLTYGDVWFCSGQSNMELPMQHALTRNRTYEMLAAGRYGNIRTYKRSEHLKLRDGEALPFILPPPAPPSCTQQSGRFSPDTPTCYNGWQIANASTVDEFSAACWFTAQELTDIEIDSNRSAPILGLVQSAW